MVLPRIAQLGLQGLRSGGGAVQNLYAGKGPGSVFGQKVFEYVVAAPLIGVGARALGLPVGLGSAPAPAPAPGGMSQQQMDFMYGKQGWSLPWQGQEAFLDRQLRTQREMFGESQQTIRMANLNNFRLGSSAIAANERLGNANLGVQERLGTRNLETRIRIADLETGRQLESIRDTNRTRTALADRELFGLRDTNRSRIKMADIGARRDMYLADRGVEMARWGGSTARVATFGSLMR